MLIDFTPEEMQCLLSGLHSWVDGPGGMGPYNLEEMTWCENAQAKLEKALGNEEDQIISNP